MRIYIVRHGETCANAEGVLQGWTDGPLNDNGRLLAAVTGKGMKDIRFDVCFSSPLVRAEETAKIILRTSGNESVSIESDDRIKEIYLGNWENKKFRGEESEIDTAALQLFFSDPFHFPGCPQGENIYQVCERTQSFLRELLCKDDYQTCLVVTHGFALRGMLNFLYDNKEDYWHGHVPYNCAVNIVEGSNGSGRLIADDIIYYDSSVAVDQYANY